MNQKRQREIDDDDIIKQIFLSKLGEQYQQTDILLKQPNGCEYQNTIIKPHFIRSDCVIIYLQMKQFNKIINPISKETIQLTMNLFNCQKTYLFTLIIGDEYDLTIYNDKMCQNYEIETIYYSNQFNHLKKRKIDISEYVSAGKTRNYALNNTLIDWMDLYYEKSTDKQYFKSTIDNNNLFVNFIMNQGHKFEENVIKILKNKFKDNFITICPSIEGFKDNILRYEAETITAINNGVPFIYQGLLIDSDTKTYGLPDLIVRSDYLHLIGGENTSETKYVIVDIKFTTLELCADGRHLRNSGSMPAYKAQLYIYNRILGKILEKEPRCAYLLGRKFKYEKNGIIYTGNSCFDRLGVIDYSGSDKEHKITAVNAIDWIKLLRKEGATWKLFPPRYELYPNMASSAESKWDNIKYEYAMKLKDITILWNCGINNREIAHSNKIFSFDDKKCCSQLLGIGGKIQAPILDEIIKINHRESFTNKLEMISAKDLSWLPKDSIIISIDFETIGNIVDDFQSLPVSCDNNFLFMIGVGYSKNDKIDYQMFLVSELTKDAEFQMILQFYNFIKSLGNYSLYHWGHIEKSFFTGLCQRLKKNIGQDIYQDLDNFEKELKWIDLCDIFKNNKIVINGCFKFGLKEIAKRLFEIGLINIKWDTNNPCGNGNTAMIMAFQEYQKKLPIDESDIIANIMEYNKIDCLVILEIINVLKKMI